MIVYASILTSELQYSVLVLSGLLFIYVFLSNAKHAKHVGPERLLITKASVALWPPMIGQFPGWLYLGLASQLTSFRAWPRTGFLELRVIDTRGFCEAF